MKPSHKSDGVTSRFSIAFAKGDRREIETLIYDLHGPHRQAVGTRRAPPPVTADPKGPPRPAMERPARRPQWHPLGATYGRTLGRSSRPISVSSDMPPSVPAVVEGWHLRHHPLCAAPRPRRARRTQARRGLRRRQLRVGEKGGLKVGASKRGKGTKWMAVVDGNGLPLGLSIESASPAEVTLVDGVLYTIPEDKLPDRLIGDKAYDSDPLAARLAEEFAIQLISPNRASRKTKTQDGRPLRRYRRRWKVERFFAWLGNFRRLVVRWERHASNYLGFLNLACSVILLRHL